MVFEGKGNKRHPNLPAQHAMGWAPGFCRAEYSALISRNNPCQLPNPCYLPRLESTCHRELDGTCFPFGLFVNQKGTEPAKHKIFKWVGEGLSAFGSKCVKGLSTFQAANLNH